MVIGSVYTDRRRADEPVRPRHGLVFDLHLGNICRYLLESNRFLKHSARRDVVWTIADIEEFNFHSEAFRTFSASSCAKTGQQSAACVWSTPLHFRSARVSSEWTC